MNNRNYSKLVREQFFFKSVAKTAITEHLTAKEKKAFQQEIYAIFKNATIKRVKNLIHFKI